MDFVFTFILAATVRVARERRSSCAGEPRRKPLPANFLPRSAQIPPLIARSRPRRLFDGLEQYRTKQEQARPILAIRRNLRFTWL